MTKTQLKSRRQAAAERIREKRASLPEGTCITCMNQSARPERRTCQECADSSKLRSINHKAMMAKQGYCIECSARKARPGMKTCRRCSKVASERTKRNLATKA